MSGNSSKVYLLHFHRPLLDSKGHPKAQHYIGTSKALEERLALHRTGKSKSCIMQELARRGIGFDVVETWEGDAHLERALKRKKRAAMLCPRCHAAYLVAEKARRTRRKAGKLGS